MKCQQVALEVKAHFQSLSGPKQSGVQIRLVLGDSGHARSLTDPTACCHCHPQVVNFQKLLGFN